ncbi:uncharacterized protein K441DRAFT_693536 [Cenococcum geophilum 1.58]|uniref:uncharacterized protein n=1 Tax=Cenococcum geophilum 1.58 TaxID=794803 RepID=UPI00358FB553|nr:hypothetical protein K441DRAFT_693536 [Cenococcum geophilum 1.58]
MAESVSPQDVASQEGSTSDIQLNSIPPIPKKSYQQTTVELDQNGSPNPSLTPPEPRYDAQSNVASNRNSDATNPGQTHSDQCESNPQPSESASPIPSDESRLQETSEDPNQEASSSEDIDIEDLTVSPALEPPEPAKPGRKLRTAKDVLNRLRWDSTYDVNDFIIVYKDRFEGNKEISVEEWKDEIIDEEFIPQHRIVQIKDSDNGVIWDRERRLDQVFFSGNS